MFTSLLTILLLGSCAFAARPDDEIKIVDFNRTFYISNETYQFVLYPQFMVPLQVYRHVIYTATTATVNANIKRALWQNKKRLIDLSPEDHDLLSNYMADPLPAFVKVNSKKRSLPADESGFRSIPLASGVALLVSEGAVDSQKRAVKLGGTLCLHIPFFTSCDNAGDVDNVKKTLQAQVDALRTEVDSYKSTNNARANEMAKVLDQQRVLINNLASQTLVSAQLIDTVASAAASNAAQQAHGDFIAHAQINYLQRVTNSLLRYANAMASTDARSVVAQPSLSELFTGYLNVLSYLSRPDPANGKPYAFTPVVDSRTFNWTENPLPSEVVKNRTEVLEPFVSNTTLINNLMGFAVATTVVCADGTVSTRCSTPYLGSAAMYQASLAERGDHWIIGPIHQQHTGVYPVQPSNYTTVTYYNVLTDYSLPRIDTTTVPTQLYCVDFMGYKSLATFNFTPFMTNGIPTPTVNPFSDCNNYLLRSRQTHLTYFLYTIREGVVVPFYSNCQPRQLVNETGANLPFSYISNFPTGGLDLLDPSLNTTNNGRQVYSVYHVNAEHWVSPNCYLNLEPEWVGLSYYINQQPSVIPNIPRGYKLNQFTINPAGELASSLEFVYTRDWAWVYQVALVSQNTVLVDEVNALDGSLVLFHVNGSTVVDASDSFYGKSNNGRDCIQKASTYEYDLTACFFQNDEKSYSSDQYLTGQVKTTGIARYTDKFAFSVNYLALNTSFGTSNSYQFSLKPKSQADFSYSVVYQGNICPKMVASSSGLSGCSVSFAYTGPGAVTFGTRPETATPMTFSSSVPIASRDVTFGDYFLYVNGLQCTVVTCPADQSLSVSTVDVSSKKIDIVSAADKALNGSVSSAVGQSAADTLQQFQQIQTQVAQSQTALAEIQNKLGGIDFNTSRIVPYEDFSEARARVDKLISQIQPGGDRQCAQGVFGSAGCWFQDLLSALIVIGILAAIGVGVYCICFKCGVLGRILGK